MKQDRKCDSFECWFWGFSGAVVGAGFLYACLVAAGVLA